MLIEMGESCDLVCCYPVEAREAELKARIKGVARLEAKAAKRREINRRYDRSEKGKARTARHNATEKRRKSRKKYDHSEKGRLRGYFYDHSMKEQERRAWAKSRKIDRQEF
jgi:hypothetical protein